MILAAGILLSALSQIPAEEKSKDITDMSRNGIVLPGHNTTYNLEDVDPDNHLSVTISQVKEQLSGRASEEGLHFYFYRDSEPTVKRYEDWAGVNSTTGFSQVNITEEGHWYLFINNEGNASLSFRMTFEWVHYSTTYVIPGRYLTYGILIIIYSVLFISIIAMRDRFKKRPPAEKTDRDGE